MDRDAVARILDIKKRDSQRGFIVIAAEQDQISDLVANIDEALKQKLNHDWPGPVTWILKHSNSMPETVYGGRETIAVRVTAHPPAAELCRQCGYAIVSTSANFSGEPPCTTATEVKAVFGNTIDYVLDQPVGALGRPTSIFDGLTGERIR